MIKMPKIFSKQLRPISNRNLQGTLDFLLTKIENSKGNLCLTNIFELISNILQEKKINSIFCIVNDNGNEIIVRHVNFPGGFKTLFTTDNIRRLNVKKLSKYQEAIINKQTIFCENRLKYFKKIIPQSQNIFVVQEEMNAIIAPLILRGEIIGVLEFLSPRFKPDNVKVVDYFVKKLVISITNNILFHEIKESEKRYRDLFAKSSDGLIFFNIKYNCFRESNKAMQEISGYTKEELKEMHYLQFFDEKSKKIIQEAIEQIKNKAKKIKLPIKICSKIKTKKQTTKICNIKIGPQINKNEVYFIFQDVTKNKLAEEENIRLTEFNKKILNLSPASIIVLDKQGKIVMANGMAKELMEFSKKSLLGKKLINTREIKSNKELLTKYKKLLKQGESFCYDNLSYISKSDKQRKQLNIVAVPLYDKNKKINGAISMATDNTEKMLAREKLEKLNKNLEKTVAERTKELDKANKELNQVLELKSKFISDASHELRTPLTVIQGNLDLAIQEYKYQKQEVPEALDLIAKEVKQMTGILADLTMLTNADVSSEIISHDKIDVNALVVAIEQSLQILAAQKRIDLIINKSIVPIYIIGDETKIEKLLLNIVRNAIKYTEEKGKIQVTTKQYEKNIKIIVQDNGIGIPSQDLPYIFERFYRVDKARSRQEGGTGLGLSICKWIAEAHGGNIQVESQIEVGSKFIITLPIDCRKK